MDVRRVSVGLVVLVITGMAQSQSVFRSDTRLVEVEAVVRDGKGPVQGLTQSDFQLFDNGKLQKISTFGVVTSRGPGTAVPGTVAQTEPPVTATVLFINNLAIPFRDQVRAERRVAEVFRNLPPREPIAVYLLNLNLRILTDFTTDPERIAKALQVAWGEQPQPPGYTGIPYAYPALEKLANELGGLPGRKNLLWFANFFPVIRQNSPFPAGYYAMLKTIKALNAANVGVYPIGAAGISLQSVSWTDATFWADSTGGVAAANTDVGFAALRALDDSQVTYSLGYYPETLDGTYHDLKVKVDRKGVDVRSRVGYLASLPVDLLTSATGDATMQVPYFYTGTDRARVHLALETLPTGMPFQKKGSSFHGQMNMAGTTFHANGGEASRFEESLGVDMESQDRADAFIRTPFHYEHEFLLLAGNYFYQMTVGIGQSKTKVTLPLNIEPWHEDAFGIGGIAFCAEGKSPDGDAKLVAGGREFALAGGNRFGKSDRVYFYTEVYEPGLAGANPPTLSMEYRVVDRNTGEVKQDSGIAGIAGYVHPGNAVVPFATTLPVAKLEPGLYRLEVRAGHSSGVDVVTRSVDFEVR